MAKYLLLFLLLKITVVHSQVNPFANNNKSPIPDSTDELVIPPLDSLYAWAEKYSFTIKQQEALIEKTGADTKRIRKSWMDAIRFSANYRTGNYGNSVINQTEVGYAYGPTISVSLYNLAGYNNLVNVYMAEEKVAIWKRDEVIYELHKIVTILYNNVLSQKNILKIKSEGLNASYVHMKMAEKEFNQGAITLGELSRVTEIYTKSQTELEYTLNDLKNFYMQLELVCGRTFYKN